MSRQDVPSSLRKWVLVRHMHKSLVQLLDFFPNARLPWHQESCSTQDLQQARPIVEASTARQYGKDLEQDSEGVSELPPSTDEVEHFGGCLDELTDAMSVLIESLIEEADLVHEWRITSQCSQLDEEVPMHLPDEHNWAKPSKSEPMSYQDLCILKGEIAQFGLDAQLNTNHPLPGDYEDIGIMALLGEPGDEAHLCEVPLHVQDRCPSTKVGGGTNLTSDLEATKEHILGSNLPLEFQGILLKYIQAFGDLPERGSVEKLIQMELRLKPEFANKKLKCRPYPCSEAHMKEIRKQVEECVRRNVVEELQHGETPTHCSPCFLVPKPGSTALRLVVDYGRLNKLTYLHAGSLPNMERTLECMARSKFKSKIDMQSGFWQVKLTPEAQRLTAFITPEGRIFRWKVMPFELANAPAVFQEIMNQVMVQVRSHSKARRVFTRGGELECHIDDVMLGTRTFGDHRILLEAFLDVCHRNHLKLRYDKSQFLVHKVEYFGFESGYGWWRPSSSKVAPILEATIKDVKDVRQFLGACNFYRRHIKNFTYDASILSDLTRKKATFVWTHEHEFHMSQLKNKLAQVSSLGVPLYGPQGGEFVLISDASDVGGGGSLYQWQKPEQGQLDETPGCTTGANKEGKLQHTYEEDWILIPIGYWNWKWNPARKNYSTYEQELLSGVLLMGSQYRILSDQRLVWFCDQQPAATFLNNPPPEKKHMRRWWTFLSQFNLNIYHLPGVKNELCDYLSRNNFNSLYQVDTEGLARKAFQKMDTQLDLGMEKVLDLPTDSWNLDDYSSDDYYHGIIVALRNKPVLFQDRSMWVIKANKLHREKQVVVPNHCLRTVLVWCHTTAQQHAGGARCLWFFQQLFFTRLSKTKIRKLIQEITESCRICIECKQNTCADRGLVGALPIRELGNQILYVDFVEVPKFGGFNYILMVCCALTRFCRVYPCTKRIDGEQAFEILFKEWIQVYGRPVEVYSDNDVRFTSEKGYWRGLLSRTGVRVHFSIP